jgi:bifunctional non-homologous end joining protein LigD
MHTPSRAAAASLGFEGAVLKRLGSHYLPGRRSRNWLKIKHVRVMDIVIGSWLPGRGAAGHR